MNLYSGVSPIWWWTSFGRKEHGRKERREKRMKRKKEELRGGGRKGGKKKEDRPLSWLLFPTASSAVSTFTNSVQLLSHVQFCATPWTPACQASLSITNSQSLLKLKSIELVMPSNQLILCLQLLLPSIFSSIRVFSSESALCLLHLDHFLGQILIWGRRVALFVTQPSFPWPPYHGDP